MLSTTTPALAVTIPDTARVLLNVAAPVTPKVPPTVALPADRVRLPAAELTLPTTERVPSSVVLPVTSSVPARSTLAPVKVAAVVDPDFRIKLALLFVKAANCVPASFIKMSAPSTSRIISPATSKVRSPEDTSISLSDRVI